MGETIIPFTQTTNTYINFGEDAIAKAHRDDAAYDLRAAESAFLNRGGGRAVVKTGVRLAIPIGFAGLVLPRSGLAAKNGVTVLNAPGLIDPGYRGEVSVILVNTTPAVQWDNVLGAWVPTGSGYYVTRGDRIAQLLIVRTADTRLTYVSPEAAQAHISVFSDTERGEGGFGSTGR